MPGVASVLPAAPGPVPSGPTTGWSRDPPPSAPAAPTRPRPNDDAFLVEIELPGVRRGDIEFTTACRRLTVCGERKEKERVGILRRRTRTVGRFRYEITLPREFDADDVSAGPADGVLTGTRLPATVEPPIRAGPDALRRLATNTLSPQAAQRAGLRPTTNPVGSAARPRRQERDTQPRNHR
ncbi:MAG: Hsp20/alpha crystallin family protein [Acidimicrobiales bacterium]